MLGFSKFITEDGLNNLKNF